MFDLGVKVKFNGIPATLRRIEETAGRIAQLKAQKIADRAAVNAPRLTGTLASDFEVTGHGTERQVKNTAPYFVYQELGTSKMPAHPSLGPAARAEATTYGGEAAAAIEKELR